MRSSQPTASSSKTMLTGINSIVNPISTTSSNSTKLNKVEEIKLKEKRPKVLLMGPRSGGKTSIRKVVFEGMAPSDTLFIEKTAKSSFEDTNSFISIDVWDLPGGQLDPDQWNIQFDQIDAVIFVLDAQSSFHDMIRKLAITMDKAFNANPGIQFEIFLHKIDGMSEDYRLDTLQNLRDRLTEDLFDMSPELESSMNVFYHLTSVFDTSIYEALSRVIQKLLPEQAMLERLLDLLCQQCSMDKAFLFDSSSKIYIATDSSPLDNEIYIICSDYIDLVGDFTVLYEPNSINPAVHTRTSSTNTRASTLTPNTSNTPTSTTSTPRKITPMTSSSINKEVDNGVEDVDDENEDEEDELPSSKVKLSTGLTIAQWGINSNVSLVAIIRPQMMELHSALIEYNVITLREAVLSIFKLGLVGKQ